MPAKSSERAPAPSSLTTVTVQILASLAHGPLHGYGIKLAIEERTAGAMTIGSGTLYQALQRLEKQNMVTPVTVEEGDSRRGRHYELRPLGREILDQELVLMRKTLSWAEQSAEEVEAPA